jgi:CubicO group peptidase (beta-lactamase class C family)
VNPWTPSPAALASVDRLAQAVVADAAAPGVGWAVTGPGGVLASGAAGLADVASGRAAATDTVWRIASMSKSFAAAACLILAERGQLDLTAPVARYLPQFAAVPRYSADSRAITIEDLLAMRSGLPEDNPWADRQEAATDGQLEALLAGGLRTVGGAGASYEYSNLGYAVLGRVVATLTGTGFIDFVQRELLAPLGLAETGYDVARFAPERRAIGYWRDGTEWVAQPWQHPGAFSAIGGLLSTTADLGRWMAWLADAFPARNAPDPGAVLPRAARRAMQTGHTPIPPVLRAGRGVGRVQDPDFTAVASYGYGLFVNHHPRWGDLVGHTGGYPGFSSSMRWHVDSGIGLVMCANGRGAAVGNVAYRSLEHLLADAAAAGRSVHLWPETAAVMLAVTAALAVGADPWSEPWDGAEGGQGGGPWGDPAAASLGGVRLAPNVSLDVPLERRRERLAEVWAKTGAVLAGAEPRAVRPVSAAHVTWRLPCVRGEVEVEVNLTPHAVPLVQTLDVRAAPTTPPLQAEQTLLQRAIW